MAIEETEKSIPELLSEATGRPVEAFEFDPAEYEFPHPKDLESVDPEDAYE